MNILIIIISIFTLILLHELGHFLLAKKFGVRVDEFGLGIPPRAYGKKIGETIYSINWLPLGGFVKLHGENERADDERSFSTKPIYQRALIVFAGVAAFFVIAFFIFSLLSFLGVHTIRGGDAPRGGIYQKGVVEIGMVVPDSPAEGAGLMKGDILLQIDGREVKETRETIGLIRERAGEEIEMIVKRGGEDYSFYLTPRTEHEEDQGAVGIVMNERFPFYYAPIMGAVMTYDMTANVLTGFYTMISTLITGRDLPEGMEVAGLVGIVGIGADVYDRGVVDFLYFLGAITVSLAVLNLLPIPALDGGRLLFLLIEKIKGGPVSEKVEQTLIAVSFLLLIGLMLIVTYGDVVKLINNNS